MTTFVADKYRLDGAVGSGAFGTVFKAEHTGIGRVFALKVLEIPDTGATRAAEIRSRFMREARILGKLDHPNVVQVFDFGEHEGRPYLVMEFVDGRTLYRRLKQEGTFSEGEVYRIGTQMLSGLVGAHELGLVHRDLKPSNVMLTPGPTGEEDVKLLDFGVAAAFRDDSLEEARNLAVTQKGTFIGTPQYAAPEQFMGSADARSDVYCIGLLLWEMIVGSPAVRVSDLAVAGKEHLSREPWALPDDVRVSRDLRAVIERALQKKPAHRYANAEAMLADMQYLSNSTAEDEGLATVVSEVDFDDQPGDVLVGKYRLGEVIGAGGFSRVHVAEHIEMERTVAVKLLDLQGAVAQAGGTTASDLQTRFGREAKLCSRLDHPNTITVYDFGVDPDGRWYIVMEYVEGLNLHAAVKREGRFEAERVARVARDVLLSLSEAHHLGILHRDLKPGNIMLTQDYQGNEVAKVLDFGISTIHGFGEGDLVEKFEPMEATRLGMFIGTPQFAAPEQFLGAELTPAADLYALGLVIWEMLCGASAIPDASFGKCMQQHLAEKPWRLPSFVSVPDGLADILYGALEKDPAKRYLSAGEMAEDLELWLGGSKEEFKPSPVTEERWQPKLEYKSTDRPVIDPNLDEGVVPEFLRPPLPAGDSRGSTVRTRQSGDETRDDADRAPRRTRPAREEKLELDYDSAHVQRSDRIIRPTHVDDTRRRRRSIPWSRVAAIAGLFLAAIVGYSLWTQEEPEPEIDLLSDEVMFLDLEDSRPADELERNRFSTVGIMRALEAGGWFVRRTGEMNALSNVHQQGYRLSRSGTELEIELVTTKSTAIAQRMADDTRSPIQVVVFDNKLVRVFPPGGRESRVAEEVVSLLRRYRDLIVEGSLEDAP